MVLTDLGHPAQQHYLNEDQEILQQAQVSALHSPGKAPSYSHSYLLWLCPHFVGQWDAAFQTEKLGILHSACNSGFVSAIYSCVLVLFPPEHLSYAPDSLALFVWLWFPYTGDADTSLLIFWLHLRVVCMCVGMCMPQCTFGGHRKTCGSWFFSTMGCCSGCQARADRLSDKYFCPLNIYCSLYHSGYWVFLAFPNRVVTVL